MQLKLLQARKESGETQGDVAKLLGVTTNTYAAKERGEIQFKMNEMFTLAEHYHSTIEDLFLPAKSTKR